MVRLTVVLSVPALVSVALTVRVNVPAAVGVPLMAMLPLPLWVNVSPAGKPVRLTQTTAGISPDRLGGRGIGVHSLRKTALNNAIQNGATLLETRELAGHADVRTTELYFVRKDQDAERAARRIAIR